jgi:transposase-like protein
MSRGRGRDYDPAFKLKIIAQLEGGTNVSELSRDLGIKRTLLYRWWDAWKRGGPDGLRRRGRPRKTPPPVMAPDPEGDPEPVTPVSPAASAAGEAAQPDASASSATAHADGPGGGSAALAAARGRIAALERKVGQQQLELDFFRQALRHFETARRTTQRSGAPASTPSSRR